MAKKKALDAPDLPESDEPKVTEISGADRPSLTRAVLDGDALFFSDVHGATITHQFKDGQVVRDPHLIRLLIERSIPLKD